MECRYLRETAFLLMYPTPAPHPCQQGRGIWLNSQLLAQEFKFNPDIHQDALGSVLVIYFPMSGSAER